MENVGLAIIGTAGRKEDQGILTGEHYQRMVEGAIKLISHLNIDPKTLHLYSGGAAWADHIVVTLVLMGVVPASALTIYLPSQLLYYGYEAEDQENAWKKRTADTCNYYHKFFSQKVGLNSLEELNNVRKMGAIFDDNGVAGGFKSRNSLVARSLGPDDHVLAYTTGSPKSNQRDWTIRSFDSTVKADDAGLKDGGTADTWNKSKCHKHHARIGPLDENYINI